MNISFDLDSTLIPNGDEFKTEHLGRLGKFFKVEKIRKGAKDLIVELQNEGHTINTVSYTHLTLPTTSRV